MAALVLAICLSTPVSPGDPGGGEPGYLQRALDRFTLEYELLSLRLDFQVSRWSIQLAHAELEREVKARTGMTLEEFVRDAERRQFEAERRQFEAERRQFADPPWFLKVGQVPYVDVADHAGPGRARFETGDFEPLCRTERRPGRLTLGTIRAKFEALLKEIP